MQVNVQTLKEGQGYKIRLKPKDDSNRFHINIGHDSKNFPLHFNPRFDHGGDHNTIVFNSMSGGSWGKEQHEGNFPFKRGEEYEIFINFNHEQFSIKLPDGYMTNFPNRLGDCNYKYLDIGGDASVIGLTIE